MNPRLPSMTAPEVVRLLERHGFERVRQSGPHLILRHADGRRTTVPMRKSKDLGPRSSEPNHEDADLSKKTSSLIMIGS